MCDGELLPTNLSSPILPSWWAGPKKFDLCIEDGEFRLNSSSRQQSVVVEEIVLGIPSVGREIARNCTAWRADPN